MNKISVTTYYIQIVATADDAAFCKLLSEPRRIEKTRFKDTYRCSLRLLPEVLAIMRGISDSSQIQDDKMRCFYIAELQRREMTSDLKQGIRVDLIDEITAAYPFLWDHQALGAALGAVNKRYNFFYQTRTGKTLMAYAIMHKALKAGKAKRCIVVCPSSIIKSWLDDAAMFPELKVVAYYSDEKQKYSALHTPCHIVLWSTGMVCNSLEMIKALKFDICFFDESSKIKSHRAKISEAALELSTTIPSWYNLSATPAPNGEEEYWVQMRTVDPYSFPTAYTRFTALYFNDLSRDKMYHKWSIKPDMKQAFLDKVNEYSIYVDQSVLTVAGKPQWHIVNFDLDPAVWQTYKQMAKEAYVEVEGRELTALQAAAVRAKLNQITSGFVMDTEAIKQNKISKKLGLADEYGQETYLLPGNTRIGAFTDILNMLGDKKCVIWANYRAEFSMLKELLGDKARYIRGGTSIKDKEDYLHEFMTGPLPYLVCHPLSLGMGVKLTAAHHAIYYSMNDSWEATHQSSQRIFGHIVVQPEACHYWVLNARNTVNDIIYSNVMNKRDSSVGLLEHLKAVSMQ